MTDPRETVVFRWLAAGDAGDLAVWKNALTATPDLRHDVQEVVVEGDVERARVVVTGMIVSDFGGVDGCHAPSRRQNR